MLRSEGAGMATVIEDEETEIRFGGRPARLNCGDGMSYALARSRDLTLLYKGGDFAATDVRPALG
jgi:ribonuclease VapC